MWARSGFRPRSPSSSALTRRPQLSAALRPLTFTSGQLMPRKWGTGPEELPSAEARWPGAGAPHYPAYARFPQMRVPVRCGGVCAAVFALHSEPPPFPMCIWKERPPTFLDIPVLATLRRHPAAFPTSQTHDIIPTPGDPTFMWLCCAFLPPWDGGGCCGFWPHLGESVLFLLSQQATPDRGPEGALAATGGWE